MYVIAGLDMTFCVCVYNETLCIYSETIERMTQFAYLGSIIDSTGGKEADITVRIERPRQYSAH